MGAKQTWIVDIHDIRAVIMDHLKGLDTLDDFKIVQYTDQMIRDAVALYLKTDGSPQLPSSVTVDEIKYIKRGGTTHRQRVTRELALDPSFRAALDQFLAYRLAPVVVAWCTGYDYYEHSIAFHAHLPS